MRSSLAAIKRTGQRDLPKKQLQANGTLCASCAARLHGSAKFCERCAQKSHTLKQRSLSESEDTKMTDSMSQADDDEGETDSEGSEEDSDDGYSSTSMSSAERNAPAYSSGGTPSTNLRHRITRKAVLQGAELISAMNDNPPKVPARPMLEVDAGSNVWYQAYVIKESKNEVKVRFPAIEPSNEEKVEWVHKGSSRIWRGSYKASQWRHLGKGAWAPRARPRQAGRKQGRVRRKPQQQGRRQQKASGDDSALQTENSTRTTPANHKEAGSMQQENEIMSPVRPKQLDHKGSNSQSAGMPARTEPAAGEGRTAADDSHRENSSKRMSSDGVHGLFKGASAQADQVSAKSNPSNSNGGFFHSEHDDHDQDRLNDTAEYDPLAKWFEVHFLLLQAAGTLSASLPASAPEAGVLPAGFLYDRTSKQILPAAGSLKRQSSSRQLSADPSRGQVAGSVGDVAGPERKRQRHAGQGSADTSSRPGASAGHSAGHHRSSRAENRGLRELSQLSMWGWDHNDHSPRDLIEIHTQPNKRLRGHTSAPPQPSASQPTQIPHAASSPPSTAPPQRQYSAPSTIPPPSTSLPINAPPPGATISRHQSSNSGKPAPPESTQPSLPASEPAPSPPPAPPALVPPAPAPPKSAATFRIDPPGPPPSKQPRKRALIVSDTDSDDDTDPPAASCPLQAAPPPSSSAAPAHRPIERQPSIIKHHPLQPPPKRPPDRPFPHPPLHDPNNHLNTKQKPRPSDNSHLPPMRGLNSSRPSHPSSNATRPVNGRAYPISSPHPASAQLPSINGVAGHKPSHLKPGHKQMPPPSRPLPVPKPQFGSKPFPAVQRLPSH